MPLTILALGAAIATLGVSADSLAKYQNTQIPAEYYLPQLWPEEFDLRPTTTLVACSAIVIAFNSMSLLMGKAQLVSKTHSLSRLTYDELCYLQRGEEGWLMANV